MTTVQLFVTCLVDSFYPQTGEAVVEILRRLGITVEFPRDQTCCGQPNFNAGLREEARPIAQHTIRVFEAAPGDIVIPSGSCMPSRWRSRGRSASPAAHLPPVPPARRGSGQPAPPRA